MDEELEEFVVDVLVMSPMSDFVGTDITSIRQTAREVIKALADENLIQTPTQVRA